mgnify:CR=1 FL=1
MIDKDIEVLIKQLEKVFHSYFETPLKLKRSAINTWVSDGDSFAINKFDIPPERVHVKKWYDNYWIYIRLNVRMIERTKKATHYALFVSISFFEGQYNEEVKNQLFRAEWDNYITDNQNIHPQPHWHITPNQSLIYKLDEITSIDPLIVDMFKDENHNSLNIHNMHFAMCGDWIKTGNMQNELSVVDDVINWCKNVFIHVKKELDYINKY